MLAIVLLVPPVAFMIATHEADVAVNMNISGAADLSSIFRWKLLGSVALAVVPHAALIFAGHWVKEAWAQVRLGRKLRSLNVHAGHCEQMAREHELLASEEYVRHVQCWRRLNAEGVDGGMAFGPFDAVFASLIERRFGGPPSPDAGTPVPPVTPPPHGHAARAH